jgi:hypothetical protein
MDFVAQPKEEKMLTNLLIIGSSKASGNYANSNRCRHFCSQLKYLGFFYTEIITINVDWPVIVTAWSKA